MLLAMATALVIAGCSKFEEFNTDPNKTTTAGASMLCTKAILNVTAFSGRDGKTMISDNALPKYVGYANEGQLGTQYNTIGATYFDGLLILPNLEQMLKEAEGTVMENSYKGVASFVRAYRFFRLTMEVGDMPYSEASKGADGLYRPKYDTQEQIFLGILDELKAADKFFSQGVAFNGDPTPFNGDPDKWRRAVNATALKILMTLSKKEDVASLNVKSRFAEIVSAGYLMQPSTGFLGLNYSTQNKHPLSGTNDLFTSRTVMSSLLVDKDRKSVV